MTAMSTCAALCEEHHLTPAIDDLVWVSHWITPVGESSRRFDTRFFMAVAPRRAVVRARRQRDDRQRVGAARRTRSRQHDEKS